MDHSVSVVDVGQQLNRKTATIGYFAGFVALGLAYAVLGPTLTDLAANVGVDLTRIAYVLSARGLGYLVGSLVGGRLYDTIKGNPVMAGSLLVAAAILLAVPFASVLWLLVGLAFLLGAFLGAVDVGGNTLLVWLQRDRVGPYMNGLHFFFGVGAFLSPVIIAQAVMLTGGVRWGYWVVAILLLPVVVLLARVPSPSSFSHDEAGNSTRAETRLRNTRLQNVRLVGLIAFFFFLYVGAESSFGGWIATYAKATGMGDAVTAAYLTSAFWGAMMVGRLLSVPMATRFSPRQVLAGDLAGCLVSVLALVVWMGNPIATWIGTFGAGLFMASIFPTAISLAERHLKITGTVTSLFFVGASLGGMSLPLLIGQLFESIGPGVTILAIALAMLLAALVLGLVLWSTRKPQQEANHA
ncbi:MAG: MFS transporter [Anaerolineae bacterium]|nr:MFS transporter [Anaerolineae bacterium]